MSAVSMDPAIKAQIDGLRLWINGGADLWLELFTNDVDIKPGKTDPSFYDRPIYPGYAGKDLLGSFGVPVLMQRGQWYIQSGPWQFGTNAGTTTVELWGWTLRREGLIVYGEQFDAVSLLEPGRPGPSIVPRLVAGDQSLLCPCPE